MLYAQKKLFALFLSRAKMNQLEIKSIPVFHQWYTISSLLFNIHVSENESTILWDS